ncbi:hypothetical protein BDK51DRAFT_31242 [Blyttiomyces helicus]|uniref:RING-type domain-containing protein n=1 Tax=Blyttiomyces helicus TaxID=388810 RepID=A0A4P9WIL2_9FUNG|nr:hypothetical protein BDK51DRAFT_31242 [Blyttiomyces helicus]|eukprot:RKO90970.1 hypothetical protein BDK51DRAFT_31242 [Blyttiomyces helicus]
MGNSFAKAKEEDPAIVFVDHGALIPSGVYASSTVDYEVRVVQRLILERRLAPFYKGLQDADDAQHTTGSKQKQLVEDGGGTEAPSPIPSSSAHAPLSLAPAPRRPTHHSSHSRNPSIASTLSSSSLSVIGLKGKRSASLPGPSLGPSAAEAASESLVSERELWKNPVECPICFLYYPRNINYSRCCDQPICTECFVEIKRPESNYEPASCPYCVEPHFGVIYAPPGSADFKARYMTAADVLDIVSPSPVPSGAAAGSLGADLAASAPLGLSTSLPSSSPLAGAMAGDQDAAAAAAAAAARRNSLAVPTAEKKQRRKSLSHKSPSVITSDELRPDWFRKQQQLALARAANQRRLALGSTSSPRRQIRIPALYAS